MAFEGGSRFGGGRGSRGVGEKERLVACDWHKLASVKLLPNFYLDEINPKLACVHLLGLLLCFAGNRETSYCEHRCPVYMSLQK